MYFSVTFSRHPVTALPCPDGTARQYRNATGAVTILCRLLLLTDIVKWTVSWDTAFLLLSRAPYPYCALPAVLFRLSYPGCRVSACPVPAVGVMAVRFCVILSCPVLSWLCRMSCCGSVSCLCYGCWLSCPDRTISLVQAVRHHCFCNNNLYA